MKILKSKTTMVILVVTYCALVVLFMECWYLRYGVPSYAGAGGAIHNDNSIGQIKEHIVENHMLNTGDRYTVDDLLTPLMSVDQDEYTITCYIPRGEHVVSYNEPTGINGFHAPKFYYGEILTRSDEVSTVGWLLTPDGQLIRCYAALFPEISTIVGAVEVSSWPVNGRKCPTLRKIFLPITTRVTTFMTIHHLWWITDALLIMLIISSSIAIMKYLHEIKRYAKQF